MAAKSRRAGPTRVRKGSSSSDPPEVKGSLCPAERGGEESILPDDQGPDTLPGRPLPFGQCLACLWL